MFLCTRMDRGRNCLSTHYQPKSHIQYRPVSLVLIIQSPEENLILCNPPSPFPSPLPPPQDKINQKDKEGGGFGSGGGDRYNNKQWRRRNPPLRQWIMQDRSHFL